MPEAAAALGITEAAVRGRIKRGTLRSYREKGAVFVVLEGGASAPNRDASSDEPSDQSQLIAVLREQLQAEREANRENRRIIAGLVQRIPELEATPEPRDEPETVAEDAGGVETGASLRRLREPDRSIPEFRNGPERRHPDARGGGGSSGAKPMLDPPDVGRL